MASLLSSVTATTSGPIARKRKSSPDIPSSDGIEPSSEGSFFSSKKRYGMDSDEEEPWGAKRMVVGKRPRVSDTTIVPDENDVGMGMDVDVDMDDELAMVKAEPMSDDELEIKPRLGPLHSAANKLNGAIPATRRKVVNSSSVKNVVAKPEPLSAKSEPDLSIKPRLAANGKPVPVGSAHWSAVQESLVPQVKTSELDEVKAPLGSVRAENVLGPDGSLRIFWLDHVEQDGVVHLVGKVVDRASGKFVSACLSVQGIKRNLFVKPRPRRFRECHHLSSILSSADVSNQRVAMRPTLR
jgi:DNA polymerase alpha subunit A